MPEVPYSPVPTDVEEYPHRIEGPRVEALPAAFGINVAQASHQLGQSIGAAGEDVFRGALYMQNLRNEAVAREAAVSAGQEMAIAQSKFDELEGKARSDALMPHLKNLNDIRTKYRTGLTMNAARMFDAEAASLQNRFTAAAAARAGEGLKQYGDQTAEAQYKSIMNDYVDPFNEGELTEKGKKVDTVLEGRAIEHGWSPEVLAEKKKEAHSELRSRQIAIQSLTDINRAFDTLDKAVAAKELSQPAVDKLSRELRGENRTQNGDLVGKAIFQKGGTLEEMEARAEEEAPKYAHGDPDFTKHVVNAIRGYSMIERQATLQQKRTDEQTVLDAIHATGPVTERDFLTANPDAAAAYRRAQAHGGFKFGLQNLIDANHNDQINQQNFDNWSALRGMYIRDRSGFLDRTADMSNIQMSKTQRGDVLALRREALKEPIQDSRIPQAIKALIQDHYAEMRDLGLLKAPPKDADESVVANYDRFLQSTQAALDEFAAANNGRKPTRQEFEDKIAKPLLRKHAEPGMFNVYGGPFGYDRGSFNQNIPKEVLDRARESMVADAQAMGMPEEFTDREIYREVLRQQWKEFFKGGGSTSQPK